MDNNDTQNNVLIKAIKLYLHQKMNLKLTTAHLDLTSLDDKNSSPYGSYYDDNEAMMVMTDALDKHLSAFSASTR